MKPLIFVLLFACICAAQSYPTPEPNDFVMRDFEFQSGHLTAVNSADDEINPPELESLSARSSA